MLILAVIVAINNKANEANDAGNLQHKQKPNQNKRLDKSSSQSKSRQPKSKQTSKEKALLDSIYARIEEIKTNLDDSIYIDSADKHTIVSQTDQVANKINVLLGRVRRTRRARRLIANQELTPDLDSVEQQINTDIQALSDVLDRLLISILDLEIDGAKPKVERLLHEVHESNQKLEDISDSFADLRHESSLAHDEEYGDYLDEYDDFEFRIQQQKSSDNHEYDDSQSSERNS